MLYSANEAHETGIWSYGKNICNKFNTGISVSVCGTEAKSNLQFECRFDLVAVF